MKALSGVLLRAMVVVYLCAGTGRAALVINEVYYNVFPQAGNQFVELYNAGATNCYLDGLVLTDEADTGVEGIFQFPGTPGGTTYPVAPGAFVTIALDATNATAGADWEFQAGLLDTDNPGVPNLTLVGGLTDFGLFVSGDNVILADGSSTSSPIAQASILDGMNIAGGNGEVAPLSATAEDTAPTATSITNYSLCRCPDGQDLNVSSFSEFVSAPPTMGASNSCTFPYLSVNSPSLVEGNSGTSNLVFTVVLAPTSDVLVTVGFLTSNGTASAGTDYVATNGTLTFSVGATSQTVTVRVNGDVTAEADEVFYLVLQNPAQATLLVPVGTGTIVDTDTVFTSAFTQVLGPVGAVTTSWTSVSGKTYQVQAATTMLTPLWTNVSGIVTATGASSTAVDTDGTPTQRFYRVLHLD
jgi:hypothetical protein